MDSKPLSGQVAIITGAGKGMGRAISLALARAGAKVAVAARTEADLQSLAEEVAAAGSEAAIFPMDVSIEENDIALVKGTVERFGRLDILVNHAGGGSGHKPWAEMDSDTWDYSLALNAHAPFILSREALPHMKAAGGGHIFMTLSIGGVAGYAGYNMYSVAKNALRALAITLSKEARKDNIKVHTISMGMTETTRIRTQGLVGRPDIDPKTLIQPEEIANIVLFLASWQGNGVIDEIQIRRPDATYWAG